MTREDVIRLALEAGIITKGLPVGGVKALEKFAALVAAADAADAAYRAADAYRADAYRAASAAAAAAIRARGDI
jgi:hypothetical protein